ncbi:uncharacterized protein LOC135806223 [Sycon ciliatum]|uniref:uncharacterized protein LOC135806223 n=1 Tax=Sycon ciliatum TaxID=27933 RepID=UPI0020ADECD5|eukprot:scpid73220/ scgid12242/ CB1 cannabinoid receptor-interacting protein 1
MASTDGGAFRVNFIVRSKDDGTTLYMKNDGERFKADNRTVKVLSQHKYEVDVSIRPPSPPERVTFGDLNLVKEKESADGASATFSYLWDTMSFPPTGSGNRSNLPIVVYLEDGRVIRTIIQCKFYKPSDMSHYRWGNELKGLELECSAKDGSVSVLKTTYR